MGDHDWALFLDFDGTLSPLEAQSDPGVLPNATTALLIRLNARLEGALCVISGRSLANLSSLMHSLDHIGKVGGHGADDPLCESPPPTLTQALARVRARVQRTLHTAPKAWVEIKPCGLDVHLARNQDSTALVETMFAAVADEPELAYQQGPALLQAVPTRRSKGAALRARMRRLPFRGRVPVMVGDDASNESGFECAEAMGGFGVLVGTRRPTQARYALPDVEHIHAWLRAVERVTHACGGTEPTCPSGFAP